MTGRYVQTCSGTVKNADRLCATLSRDNMSAFNLALAYACLCPILSLHNRSAVLPSLQRSRAVIDVISIAMCLWTWTACKRRLFPPYSILSLFRQLLPPHLSPLHRINSASLLQRRPQWSDTKKSRSFLRCSKGTHPGRVSCSCFCSDTRQPNRVAPKGGARLRRGSIFHRVGSGRAFQYPWI